MAYLREVARARPEDPLPRALAEEPDTTDLQEYILESFLLISQGRPYGFAGPLSIPTADVAAFLMIHPICEPLRFLAIVRELDSLFMEQAYPPSDP